MNIFHPRLAIVVHDLFMTWAAWMLSYIIRYSIWPDSPELSYFNNEVALVILIQGFVAYFFNLYHGIWRFASVPDLMNISKSAIIGTLAIGFVLFLTYRAEGVPRTVLLIYPVFLTLFWGIPRIAYRVYKDSKGKIGTKNKKNVLLIGAGRLADMFIRQAQASEAYQVCGIIDDRSHYQGSNIRGIKVLGKVDSISFFAKKLQAEVLAITHEDITQEEMKIIVDQSMDSQCKLLSLPNLDKIDEQGFELSNLAPVTIDDLLGRKKISLDWSIISELVKNKSILITGGGGSIGSELARQLCRFDLKGLTILDHAEHNLYQIDRELNNANDELIIKSLLVNVTDKAHLFEVFSSVKPDLVFHAAAYKHVPLLEKMPCEGFMNNVVGTKNLVDTCNAFGVEKMIMVSTDKAVNPYSIMGATKRIAELYCQFVNKSSKTEYNIVRFGNVLASAGSVVPLFKEQIANGGPVTVTHKDMTRYFMTIEEACQLIVQSLVIGGRNEIHVLDMGQPISILSLAKRMITLSGKTPDKDIAIKFTGLRTGEKLHEQLYYDVEELKNTSHQNIFSISSLVKNDDKFITSLNTAINQAISFKEKELTESIKTLVPEFVHQKKVRILSNKKAES